MGWLGAFRFWASETIQNAKYAIFKNPIPKNTKCAARVRFFFVQHQDLFPIISVAYCLLHNFFSIVRGKAKCLYWAKCIVIYIHFARYILNTGRNLLFLPHISPKKHHYARHTRRSKRETSHSARSLKHSLGLVEKILTLDDLFWGAILVFSLACLHEKSTIKKPNINRCSFVFIGLPITVCGLAMFFLWGG